MPYTNERANPYRVRLGIDVPDVGGMNTERDPSAIPPSQFQRLENVDVKGERLVNRSGLAKVNSSAAMTGSVMGIADDRAYGVGGSKSGNGSGTRLYYLTTNAGLALYDAHLATTVETNAQHNYPDVLTWGLLFFDPVEGFVYVAYHTTAEGTAAYLKRFRPGVVTKPSATVKSAESGPEAVIRIPDAGYYITSMCRVGSDLYIGTAGESNGTGKVYRWNGTSVTTEDSRDSASTNSSGTYLAVYRDAPVVIYDDYETGTVPVVRHRDDTGTWNARTFPGAEGVEIHAICEYKDKLFIAGNPLNTANKGEIWQLSGSTITSAHNITSMSDTGIYGLVEYNGTLYYAYEKDEDVLIGTFDNSSFTDAYATVLSGTENRDAGPLIVQGTKMYAVVQDGSTTKLYSAALSALTSWASTATLDSTAAFSRGSFRGYQVLVAV